MSLESFYGGKQGLSSVIKKIFKYISTDDPAYKAQVELGNIPDKNEVMEECFKDTSFKEVWYGELCLINTVNKNNPANGCIFRRTLKGQGSAYPIEVYSTSEQTNIASNLNNLSAEYLGQIVGPQGGTPFASIGTLANVAAVATDTNLTSTNQIVFEVKSGDDIPVPVLTFDEQLGDRELYQHDALAEHMFVPGRETDDVKYVWCNVRDNTTEGNTQSWVYLGFQVPYLEVDWTFNTVNYYDTPEKINLEDERIFFQHWSIDIPRGVRGNAAGRIRRTNLAYDPVVYKNFADVIKQTLDVRSVPTAEYYIDTAAAVLTEQDIDNYVSPRDTDYDYRTVPFFVYDYTIYNDYEHHSNGAGETVTIFMGFDKDIKNFTLSNDGVVTAHYTDHSYQDINTSTPIIWVDTITAYPANAAQNAGHIVIEYNNAAKPTYDIDLALVQSAAYDDTTGTFTFGLTDSTTMAVSGTLEHPSTIDLVGDIADDASNKTADRRVSYTTNLGNSTSIGSPINYIQDIIVTDDRHLCILFNDPTHRAPVGTFVAGDMFHSGAADENGILWRENLLSTKTINGVRVNYGAGVYWRDYGATIKYHDKLYVGYALPLIKHNDGSYWYDWDGDEQTYIQVHNEEEVRQFILNQKWPNGLPANEDAGNNEELDMRGMLVTAVLKNETLNIDVTHYFAYDYEAKEWVHVQESTSASATDIIINDEDLEYTLQLSAEGVIASTMDGLTPTEPVTVLPLPWLPEGSGTTVSDLVWQEALNEFQGADMIDDIWGE